MSIQHFFFLSLPLVSTFHHFSFYPSLPFSFLSLFLITCYVALSFTAHPQVFYWLFLLSICNFFNLSLFLSYLFSLSLSSVFLSLSISVFFCLFLMFLSHLSLPSFSLPLSISILICLFPMFLSHLYLYFYPSYFLTLSHLFFSYFLLCSICPLFYISTV